MKRIGIVMVGLGPGSQPHLKSLWDLRDRVDLRWAVCRQPDRADRALLPAAVPVTADLARALSDPEVDMAIVATPPATHLPIALECLERGKHLLLEKPLEVSFERSRELVARVARSSLSCGVVLQHRFRPGSIRLREILAAEKLGPVMAASVRVPWWRPQDYYDQLGRGSLQRDGGGVLLTQAIHSLDLFRSLVGITTVEAAQVLTTSIHQMETEDYASALIRLGNGAPGSVFATTAMYPGAAETIEIIGQLGGAVLTGGDLKVSLRNGEQIQVDSHRGTGNGGTGGGANVMDFPHDAHRALIEEFLEAIREGRQPLVSAAEALESQRVIELILARSRAAAEPR
jgi:predicted dehydrogenase